ncbi:MAG: hypothetical protein GX640_09130 [Fibrobacter sp.]|nr:hypothetical protein [Fibrobacter sp.]
MDTAIRFKQKINSDKLVISSSEFKKLIGKEVEIIILCQSDTEEDMLPPKALLNSPHVAGSVSLDQEAMLQMMQNRFK